MINFCKRRKTLGLFVDDVLDQKANFFPFRSRKGSFPGEQLKGQNTETPQVNSVIILLGSYYLRCQIVIEFAAVIVSALTSQSRTEESGRQR